MLLIKLQEVNSREVIYKYYPNDNFKISPGLVKMDKEDLSILEVEKSGIETGNRDNYLIHAIGRIQENTIKNKYPESELVAWG